MERKKLLIISAAAVTVVLTLSATGVLALLANYVSITGQATVDQSVTLEECHLTWLGQSNDQCTEGDDPDATWSASASGGDTRSVGINLVNSAQTTDATVDFVLAEGGSNAGTIADGDVTVILFDDYNIVTEECEGSVVSMQDLTVQSGGGDNWFCLEMTWDIAANPGTYDFTVDVNPN